MTAHWWNYLQLFPLIVVLFGLLWRLRARLAEWPCLAAFVVLKILEADVYLLHVHHVLSYAAYYYSYWPIQCLLPIAGIGIIHDSIRSLPLSEHTPAFVKTATASGAIVIAAGCWLMAWKTVVAGQTFVPWVPFVLRLNECAAFLWAAFSLSLLIAIFFMGFSWTPLPLKVTSTSLLIILTDLSSSIAMVPHKAHRHEYAYAKDCIETALIAFWYWSFAKTELSDVAQTSLQVCIIGLPIEEAVQQ